MSDPIKDARQVHLIERLRCVPKTARLTVDEGSFYTNYYAVGSLCHEAADILADREKSFQNENQAQAAQGVFVYTGQSGKELEDFFSGYTFGVEFYPRPPTEASKPVQAEAPNYSDMSREALERHAMRMAQALADDKPREFYAKHSMGPMMMPSCLCCGQLPEEVAIKHMELPGIVVCKKCRDAALATQPTASNAGERIKRLSRWEPTGAGVMSEDYTGGYLRRDHVLAALAQVPEQVAGDREDAENYRWLCKHMIVPAPSLWDNGVGFVTPAFPRKSGAMTKAELDAAIRAARTSGEAGHA